MKKLSKTKRLAIYKLAKKEWNSGGYTGICPCIGNAIETTLNNWFSARERLILLPELKQIRPKNPYYKRYKNIMHAFWWSPNNTKIREYKLDQMIDLVKPKRKSKKSK